MKQEIVFLIGAGVSANERDEAHGIIADFKRDFEVTAITLNGDDALDEAANAVRTADIWVIVGASLSQHPVTGLLGDMKADCRLFVIGLEPVEWPDICKGKQVLHLLRRIPVGLRRLKRWLLPIKIYVSDYNMVGYLDLKDLVEQYPLKYGQAEAEAYWQDERHLKELLEMLSHSSYYRVQMQKQSVAETLESWVEEAPALRRAYESGVLRQAIAAGFGNL